MDRALSQDLDELLFFLTDQYQGAFSEWRTARDLGDDFNARYHSGRCAGLSCALNHLQDYVEAAQRGRGQP